MWIGFHIKFRAQYFYLKSSSLNMKRLLGIRLDFKISFSIKFHIPCITDKFGGILQL
ncbi:hypothetical protein EVA_09022 [gut metagenome]|uniref:Uncharacterized protein n=1 Tax=gut metagenome TaxID=749906 RepID=J9GRT1_9ZZZZ